MEFVRMVFWERVGERSLIDWERMLSAREGLH